MRRCGEPSAVGALGTGALLCLLSLASPATARAGAPPSISATTYVTTLAASRQTVHACAAAAAACDAARVPARQHVQLTPDRGYDVSWEWLQDALNGAKTASGPDRLKAMQVADAHLAELAAEADGSHASAPGDFQRARTAANAALARDEFRASAGPGWVERQMAKVQDWILRLFTGMDRIGRRAPWLAPAIEWSCFALALAGLLWFVRQSLARQALRISLGETAALTGGGEHDSANWARLAEKHAAAQEWREALHCLYWAAIALLEGQRAWRPNATRTPREYLRLLRPDSDAHLALRELTRAFERAWYGHEEVHAGQYDAALQRFRALEAARPERMQSSPEALSPGSMAAAGGV